MSGEFVDEGNARALIVLSLGHGEGKLCRLCWERGKDQSGDHYFSRTFLRQLRAEIDKMLPPVTAPVIVGEDAYPDLTAEQWEKLVTLLPQNTQRRIVSRIQFGSAPIAEPPADAEVARCDGCQFWDRWDEDSTRGIANLGRCKKALEIWDASRWNDDEDDPARVLTEEGKSTKMFVADGSDYSARLMTAKDFHCAHFIARQRSAAAKEPS